MSGPTDRLVLLDEVLALLQAVQDRGAELAYPESLAAVNTCHSIRDGLEALPARDLPALLEEAAREHVGEILFDAGAEPEEGCLLCDLASAFEIWQEFGFEPPEDPEPTPDGFLRWGDDGQGNPSLWEITRVAIQPAGHALMVAVRVTEEEQEVIRICQAGACSNPAKDGEPFCSLPHIEGRGFEPLRGPMVIPDPNGGPGATIDQ